MRIKELNDKTTLITNVIFSSGQYGSNDMAVINRAIRDSASSGSIRKTKFKNILDLIFPSFDKMKREYPILNKIPALLPVVWLIRDVGVILLRRKNLNKYLNKIKNIEQGKVDENKKALKFVGLDFTN